MGYAAPIGSAEQGSRIGDTAFGNVPFALEGAYRLTPAVGVSAHAQYGVAIPTLCESAADCEASLGSDVAAELGARFYIPHVGPLVPLVDIGLGYEWLTTRLVDAGAKSTRAYDGPLLFAVQVAAPLVLGKHWTLGPVFGASLGTFTRYSLETSAWTFSGAVSAHALHGWVSTAIRVSFAP
jgi:hypothetical protein